MQYTNKYTVEILTKDKMEHAVTIHDHSLEPVLEKVKQDYPFCTIERVKLNGRYMKPFIFK